MPATASDIKFFAAQTQTDTADGGGPRSSTVVQIGTADVFPLVSAGNRTSGATKLRKVYNGPTNSDNAPVFGASVTINEVPADTAVSVALFKYGDATTRRAAALDALKAGKLSFFNAAYNLTSATATAGSDTVTSAVIANGALQVNQYYFISNSSISGSIGQGVIRRVLSQGTTTVFDAALPFSGTVRAWLVDVPSGSTRVYGYGRTIASMASGDSDVVMDSTLVRIAPWNELSPAPASVDGFGATAGGTGANAYDVNRSAGRVPYVETGDTATLWNEQATSPSTYSNGQTISAGRTSLDQAALVDSTGVEVMRWLSGGPTPAGGFATVDLSTGVLTFVNVSGLSQPCFLRHRIAHRCAITQVGNDLPIPGSTVAASRVSISPAVTRSFPSGSVLSTHVPLGDVQARAYSQFGQQAWTNVWSDSLIGSAAPTQYTGAITVTNQGAETDRWAIIFTASNTFKLYSERLGLVASGNTTSTFAPLNPATGAAYFSLASSGWATDILVGSVFRFNTDGACPPVWAIQSIAPSSPSGTTRTALRFHGTVA